MRIALCAMLAAAISWPQAHADTYIVTPATHAPKGMSEIHISKAAVAGQQIRAWWATMLNPDCTPAGTIDARIVQQPKHGQFTITADPLYPNFISPNPRADCDAKKVPGKQGFYTSEPGFHGHDRTILQVATSEGRMRRVLIDIEVQ